jgi:hypothetical protein
MRAKGTGPLSSPPAAVGRGRDGPPERPCLAAARADVRDAVSRRSGSWADGMFSERRKVYTADLLAAEARRSGAKVLAGISIQRQRHFTSAVTSRHVPTRGVGEEFCGGAAGSGMS